MLVAPHKIPPFHGDNVIGSREHWDSFMEHIIDLGIDHLYVVLKFFLYQ
jgi:hypothetical protein